MFVSALAAGLIMFADVTPAAPVQTAQAAKPEMKRVCVKSKSDNTNIPKVSCYMQAVKPAATEMAKVGEETEASSTTAH
jgi:hypothetical protein